MHIQFLHLTLTKTLAYLDPGSGSMILQLVLAALLGMGVLLRSQWKKIKTLFGRKDTREEDEQEEQDDEPEK
jgi:hypothetical protein